MTLHPNTVKRLVAALIACVAVFASFGFLKPEQAAAVSGLISAVAAIWHPRHRQRW